MKTRYLLIGLLSGFLSFTAHAQTTLENLVSDSYSEWMFGNWQSQTDSGETVTLKISWDLDKRVVVLHVKAGEMESKGYTVLPPGAELPQYYSFDNRGAVGKGSWNMESEELVLRVESESPDRGPIKAGFVFTGSSSSGLQVRMHSIDSSGNLVTPARTTLKFKKQA